MRGTRIPVCLIVNWVESGHSAEEIVEEYPDLTVEDIAAALAFEQDKQIRSFRS